ncbi:maleylpyruvate isomerase N-terminal domain-containing protein [Micromonospora arborensis]|uniref:maleylpyruvate isomerase N-terminal domain-containing protein n=1 Tax=Micromonospora arborensis TaxID=2116518 RepID=UPI0033E919F4
MTATRPHAALAQAYDGITAVIGDLDDAGLQQATRCQGWLVADLLLHMLDDAQRALVALASPVDGPADTDDVSYWRNFPAGSEETSRHAWRVRRSAAAFDRPTGIVRLWRETAPAAVRAAASANPDGYVTTQGHVLRVPDFLATLTTEAVVHHLDLMTPALPSAPPPGPLGVRVAVTTMDGLLSDDTVRPAAWDDHDFLLKATGRVPLTDRDRLELGESAGWFPLLG